MCLQHEPGTPIKQLIFITNKVSCIFRIREYLCVLCVVCVFHLTKTFGKLGKFIYWRQLNSVSLAVSCSHFHFKFDDMNENH